MIGDKSRELLYDVSYGTDVYRRFTAEIAEDFLASDLLNHAEGIFLRQGSQPEDYIHRSLNKNPSQAEHHGMTKLAAEGGPYYQFYPSGTI